LPIIKSPSYQNEVWDVGCTEILYWIWGSGHFAISGYLDNQRKAGAVKKSSSASFL